MNEGVKLLIARMESNPEDFEDRDFEPNTGRITRGKFKGVADMLKKRLSGERPAWDAMNVLTTEEIEALTAAYLEMERKKFTNGIMAKLLEEPAPREEYAGGFFANIGTAGPLTTTAGPFTTTVGSNVTTGYTVAAANTNSQLSLTPSNIAALNEMIEAWRKEDE